MLRHRFVPYAYLVLVFVSGVVVGTFGHKAYSSTTVKASAPRTPENWKRNYEMELKTRLGLSQEQQASIDSVLEQARSKYRALREKNRPELAQIHALQVAQVRQLLTDSQKAEFEKIVAEHEKRHSEAERSAQAEGQNNAERRAGTK